MAFNHGYSELHDVIRVRIGKELLKTTAGRIIFNQILPEKLKYVNEILDKKKIKNLIKDCLSFYGEDKTVEFIDDLKNLSFKYITKSGLSFGFGDLPEISEKDQLIEDANDLVSQIQDQFEDGLLTDSERYSKIIETWTVTKEKISDLCKDSLKVSLPVYSMIDSGARGSGLNQFRLSV